MKKRIRILSAAVIAASVFSVLFCSCSNSKKVESTTSATQTTGTTARVYATDYTYITYTNPVLATSTTREHIVPPVPTTAPKKTQPQTEKESKASTTAKTVSSENIDEINEGVNVITKTTPVKKGNFATLVISGKPNTEYSIEFYETADNKASYKGLENKVSDSGGFTSWSFEIMPSCESGKKKIIIREKGSDNFVQTSITVE